VSTLAPITTVGIDVGGGRKGFHAVALRDGAYAGQLASRDVAKLSHWCRVVMGATVIAIDTRSQAVVHPTNYFGWMLRGEALFQALEATHPLLSSLPIPGPVCFETFPHAITWHLRGGNAIAAQKHPQRRALLVRAGLDPAPFTRIDLIDAALCALAAHQAASGGACVTYGEPETGLIVVPRGPLA